jgi:antitoxin (DNA-binding transcriptional repressor) of toxin-antitoxin stability system
MQTISATELARNTRDVLDRVASQGETVAIERNGTLIAQVVPPVRTMTAVQVFAGLKMRMLTPTQGSSWLKDSQAQFGQAVTDPWA